MKNIAFLALAPMVLLGCRNEPVRAVQLSPLFNVCATLGVGDSYRLNTTPPVDFDDGHLRIGEREFDVYVGFHPDFPRKGRATDIDDSRYAFVGTHSAKGVQKLLLARRRSEKEVVFVMFSRQDMTEEDVALLKRRNFLKTCGG